MAPETDIPIIILAAGASRRMRGTDKLLQTVGERPLIRRQADIARAATRGEVIVTLPPRPHPRYDALTGADLRLVPVADADEGMNASLRAGFAALRGDENAAMLLLGDLPELTAEDIRTVAQSVVDEPENLIWRGATMDGKPGHPVIFSAALFGDIARLSGDGGARGVVARAGARVVLVPLAGARARRDLDTPEEWAAWRAGTT